jgi:hypothetical protein
MTEAAGSTGEQTDTKDKGQNGTPPPPDPKTVQVRQGEIDGYKTQIKQLKEQTAELDDLRKFKTEQDAAAKKAAEEAQLKAGEHEKIIAEREKTIDDLRAQLAAKEHEALVATAASRLTDVQSVHARDRIAELWAQKPEDERKVDGSFEAFIEAQKKADPKAFEVQLSQVSGDRAGTPTGSADGTLLSRLKSDDTATKKAAYKEAAQLRFADDLPDDVRDYLDNRK